MKPQSTRARTVLLLAALMAPAICLAVGPASASNEVRTERYFQSIRNDPNQLLVFMRQMPKGGDLHGRWWSSRDLLPANSNSARHPLSGVAAG